MKDFKKRGGFGGGAGGYQRRDGGNDFAPRQMHPATCSKCGKACEVPFRPTGERPVYCRECFGLTKTDAPRDNYERPNYSERKAFVPSAPSAPREDNDKRFDDLRRQMDVMQSKLDRVLQAVEGSARAAATVQTEKTVNAKVAKVVEEAKKMPKKIVKGKAKPAKKGRK